MLPQLTEAGSFDEVSTATGHLDRLVNALGQSTPGKRRQSSSPENRTARSDKWKRASRRSKSPTASLTAHHLRTPSLGSQRSRETEAGIPGLAPQHHGMVRDFLPTPPHSPMNKLHHARYARLSIVHEQDEKSRLSTSTLQSRLSDATSKAASLIKVNDSSESSIVIGVGVGTPGPDARSLQIPAAPYDVSTAESPPPVGSQRARRGSSATKGLDESTRRVSLYPREALTMWRAPVPLTSTTLSTEDRDSFDFTTELAGLESGTDRISFIQALEQSRNFDGMFGMTLAIDRSNHVTKCSPSVVKPSRSEVSLPSLEPLPPKHAPTYWRKPKSSTAPFAGQPGFSLPGSTVARAPPQIPLPPLPAGSKAVRSHDVFHQKQPSGFSFMSLSSLGEPLEGVNREGQPTFERNYEGISDPPGFALGSTESLSDLRIFLDHADYSLRRQRAHHQASTATTDSHLLDTTMPFLPLPRTRLTSMQSMSSRVHQNSSSTLASVNEAEISVVAGPPVDLRRHRQAPSVYSIRRSNDSNATVVPSPTQGTRTRCPSDTSSVYSYGRVERPTLGARMFDCDQDYTLQAMCPMSSQTSLEYQSFRGRECYQDVGDYRHPYSAEDMSRTRHTQASPITIDLGKPSSVWERNHSLDQRSEGSGSISGFSDRQHSLRSTLDHSRASNFSDQTVRLSVSLPRVFHSRDNSISSGEEPYGGALDHYLESSPLATIADRFTAALNSGAKGCPARTSVLRPKGRSNTRRHRPPRLRLSGDRADNESLPDLISPGDTSTEVSSLFSVETRNSIPPSGVHPLGRVSSSNVDVQPTIREESSFGTIRAGSPRNGFHSSLSSDHLSPLEWERRHRTDSLPTFMPSSYNDIRLFLAKSQEAYRPLDQVSPVRVWRPQNTANSRLSSASSSCTDVPPPETRYRNMRSNSDGDPDVPASSLLAHFARDSQVCSNTLRPLERRDSNSSVKESSLRSSVTDSARRRNLGWRRKRHSEDVSQSEAHRRGSSLSTFESLTEEAGQPDALCNRKCSTASAASPLPKFIAFSPPAPPRHSKPRKVVVDANGSPYAGGWEEGPAGPAAQLRVRSRDFSPLKYVSSKRSLHRGSGTRQPLKPMSSRTNIEAKGKVPLPGNQSQAKINQQVKTKGRSHKPKTPKMVPLKHQALPTKRGQGHPNKENAVWVTMEAG